MSQYLEKNAYFVDLIEAELMKLTSESKINSDQKVAEAMRYSLLSGGKRVRPILTISVAESFGCKVDRDLLTLASAIEMIHSYSLIHDDLPSMDNDDFRRGKPTNHKVYGEGMATLAGDGLLNLAYEELFELCLKHPNLLKACKNIAKEAGVQGMIGGQSMDMSEHNVSGNQASLEYLIKLQKLKTGGLIRAATLSGYYYAESVLNSEIFNSELEQLFVDYADTLGLVFQIRDDLLDVISNKETLGKSVGKDSRDDKLTFVTLLGVEKTSQYEKELHAELYDILLKIKACGVDIEFLDHYTLVLMHRNY